MGDADAFEHAFRARHPPLCKFAYRYVRSRDENLTNGAEHMTHRLVTVLIAGAALVFSALAAPGVAQAQGDTLTGRVTDTTGAPLAGARVIIVGTRFGAGSGADGRYVIANVPAGTYRVQARLIGYAVAEVADVVVTEGRTTTAEFRLVPQAIELNPVVAIGYGEQSKATLTGAVSAVSGKELQSVPAVNVSNMITGKLPIHRDELNRNTLLTQNPGY